MGFIVTRERRGRRGSDEEERTAEGGMWSVWGSSVVMVVALDLSKRWWMRKRDEGAAEHPDRKTNKEGLTSKHQEEQES